MDLANLMVLYESEQKEVMTRHMRAGRALREENSGENAGQGGRES